MAVTAALRPVDACRNSNSNSISEPECSSATNEKPVLALHHSLDTTAELCDACPFCADKCSDPHCADCCDKAIPTQTPNLVVPTARPTAHGRIRTRNQLCRGNSSLREYTFCEIARHNHADSCWLVAGNDVYDVTPYLQSNRHPGGEECLLKKAGGVVDCSVDLNFHSKNGKRLWQRFRIGTVKPCPGCDDKDNSGKENNDKWWMFWS